MRVCIRKSDNRIIEAQSGDQAALDALLRNAEAAGYQTSQVDVRVMPDQEFRQRLAAQEAADRAASPEFIRETAFKAETDRTDLIERLKTATPAQISTWVDNNVTNIAQARAVFKAILKVIALDHRT